MPIQKIWNKSKAFAKHGKHPTTKYVQDKLYARAKRKQEWFNSVRDAFKGL